MSAPEKTAPARPCRPVITCTFTDRWVACDPFYRFQLPAADGSREACEPRNEPASRITKCGLKKDLSRTAQGSVNPILFYALTAAEEIRCPLRRQKAPP